MLDQETICIAAQVKLRDLLEEISKQAVYFGKECEALWDKADRIWAGLKALQCSADLTTDQIQCVLANLQQYL